MYQTYRYSFERRRCQSKDLTIHGTTRKDTTTQRKTTKNNSKEKLHSAKTVVTLIAGILQEYAMLFCKVKQSKVK